MYADPKACGRKRCAQLQAARFDIQKATWVNLHRDTKRNKLII